MLDVVSVADAREQFSDLMAKVAYGGQRLIVERRGRPLVAWVSIEDLHRLQELETAVDRQSDVRRDALAAARAARQRIQIEKNGVPLPDAAEVIAALRKERTDDISGVR